MNLLGCLAAFVAAALFYLSVKRQRLLARPLGRRARLAAYLASVVALACWMLGQEPMAGIFAALTALMLAGVLLPYLAWLWRPATARHARGNGR